MAGHNPREKRLFTDLFEKNRLAAEFRRLANNVRRWEERSRTKRSKRWRAQYALSMRRATERMAQLHDELLERARDLKTRIQEEQKISESEVKKFEQHYKKEVAELKQAQQELAEARKAFADAEAKASAAEPGSEQAKEAAGVLADLRRRRWSAGREARLEARDIEKTEREIASEQRDKEVLAYELRRTIAEIESLQGSA